jgi:glycerol-3-phosphate acyltransferase PlsY
MIASLVVFVAMVAWSRHISLGSIVAAGTFPLAVWLILQPSIYVVVAALIAGIFVILRHKTNIQRLREGSERTLSWGKQRP